MNVFSGIGRLTADPDVRYNGDLCVARYTLAIDRRKDETDFLRCVCFGKVGEFAEKYLRKGAKVGVVGRVQTGSYKDKDGRTVYTTDIVVNEHTFCESKGNTPPATKAPKNGDNGAGIAGFMQIPDGIDEELPFN